MKKTITLLLALALCLSLCACQEKVAPEMIEAYNNANACFSQNRYEDAAKFYIEAGDYEDSQQKLLEIYYYAVSCFEQEKYDEALSLFDLLSDSVEFTSSSVYDKALINARSEINYSNNRTNASVVCKWLDVAMAHATEEQMSEVNEYKELLSQKLYEGTLFWKPSIWGASVTEETIEGEYTHYHYYYDSSWDADDFSDTHTLWYKYYEKEELKPVPKWLNDITGFDYDSNSVYYDAYGNMLTCTFRLGEGGTADVYIIYAEHIESMKS